MKSVIPEFFATGAEFDESRTHRFSLYRRWDITKPACTFVMLNPSTADENTLDPTITRCVMFADRWGYGTLKVVNLFSFRATDPKELTAPLNFVKVFDRTMQDRNDAAIRNAVMTSLLIVGAWGNHGCIMRRGEFVATMIENKLLHTAQIEPIKFMCLGVTKQKQPTHPLYIAYTTPLVTMPGVLW